MRSDFAGPSGAVVRDAPAPNGCLIAGGAGSGATRRSRECRSNATRLRARYASLSRQCKLDALPYPSARSSSLSIWLLCLLRQAIAETMQAEEETANWTCTKDRARFFLNQESAASSGCASYAPAKRNGRPRRSRPFPVRCRVALTARSATGPRPAPPRRARGRRISHRSSRIRRRGCRPRTTLPRAASRSPCTGAARRCSRSSR